MKKGPFEVLETKKIYKNSWIEVTEDEVIRPDGSRGIFGVVNYSPGVHIMAVDSEGKVILIKEYMYAIEFNDTMFPAGGIERGEEPLTAAKRELLEEIGYESNEWTELGMIHPMTMVVKAPFYLFLAKNCRKVKDGENLIKPIKANLEEVKEMIENGAIKHAGSIVAFYKAQKYLK